MKTLILIDGHALAFREYYALERTNMTTSENQPTWAVYGFFKAVFDLLKNKKFKPDSIAVAFDVHKKTFRTEKFEEYKANRSAMPDNLRCQMDLIKEGLKAFSIPVYTMEGFEADDVIGTISKQACEHGYQTYILTGDRDSFQLVDKQGFVKVLIPQKGDLVEYDWDKVYERMGVYPDQIVDFKALSGDQSDNIPGIKGIGPKTAQNLLAEYKNLENIYAHCDEISKNSVKTKIQEGKEIAQLSQYLATILRDLEVNFDFEKACVELPEISKVTDFLQKMQFYSFIKNINGILQSFNANCQTQEVVFKTANDTQLGLFTKEVEAEINKSNHEFEKLDMTNKIEDLVKLLSVNDEFAFIIESLNNENTIITNLAFCLKDNNLYKTYLVKADVNLKNNLELLKPFFEDCKFKKLTYNLKSEYSLLKNYGIKLQGVVFDVVLASYVKDPTRQHELKNQALENINFVINDNDDVICDEVYAIYKLTEYRQETLDEKEKSLISDIELPLSYILADMEDYGVSVDKDYLKTLTQEYTEKLSEIEKKIYKDISPYTDKTFNINSPKQVSDILYNELGIKEVKKKNKFTTSAEVLENLADDYPVCADILEYRKYSKLKSTYTEALPLLISAKDGKIHTSFNQTVTATGRLSSSNPNLQNIPTRTEDSVKIRKAFIPTNRDTQVLLSADYSQIELRLLAHCSGDKHLVSAFNSDEDIHAQVAAKIFGVSLNEVTKDMRRKAKRVNFGIVYGQSRFGLAKALGISPQLAGDFIAKYFKTYPDIHKYMTETIDFAYKNGYVQTIFGRKRYLITNLNSSNRHIREAAERAAINQPLQGSAADLIKMAMITLNRRLTEAGLKSKIILQVHDELIVETELNELDLVKSMVKDSMELNQPLKVPLVVDIEFGKNWIEL